jgi:exosortase/archaeosortase family protein
MPFLVVGTFLVEAAGTARAAAENLVAGDFDSAAAGLAAHRGFLIQQPLLSVVALFTGIYGLMGLAWGREWLRHSNYPFLLFIFSIPLATHRISFCFRCGCWSAGWWKWWRTGRHRRHPVGTQLFDPSGSYGYDVAAACGGMSSLIAIFLLATVYAFGIFRSPGKRLFLMATALPFAVLGNMVRMLCIIIAAEMGGQKWGDYVHEGGRLESSACCPIFRQLSGCFGRALAGKPGKINPPERSAHEKSKVDSFFRRARFDGGTAGA